MDRWFLILMLVVTCPFVVSGENGAGDLEPGVIIVGQTRLTPVNGTDDGRFGRVVGYDGSTLIVSAYLADAGEGMVHVFQPGDTLPGWTEAQELQNSAGNPGDGFGTEIDIDGDTMVVGAFHADPQGDQSGAATVFERDATGQWNQMATLVPADSGFTDNVGISVAIDGDIIIVGSRHDDDLAVDSGAAYIYSRDPTSEGGWRESAKLKADQPENGDWFGVGVAIDGSTVVIGARYRDHLGQSAVGSAFVFEPTSQGLANWTQVAELVPNTVVAETYFGRVVAIEGDRIAVGGYGAGIAEVFERNRTTTSWQRVAVLPGGNNAVSARFGDYVALDDRRVVVGGPMSDINGVDSGEVRVFEKSAAGDFVETHLVFPEDPQPGERFGYSVAIHGGTLIAGAVKYFDDQIVSGATYLIPLETHGACCLGASCIGADEHICDGLGGTFNGSATVCIASTCEVIFLSDFENADLEDWS